MKTPEEAKQILADATGTCQDCDGTGYLGNFGPFEDPTCRPCKGTGRVPLFPEMMREKCERCDGRGYFEGHTEGPDVRGLFHWELTPGIRGQCSDCCGKGYVPADLHLEDLMAAIWTHREIFSQRWMIEILIALTSKRLGNGPGILEAAYIALAEKVQQWQAEQKAAAEGQWQKEQFLYLLLSKGEENV